MGDVVSVFLLYFPSYDVINDVIMTSLPGLPKLSYSDADCTPGREPRSVAASSFIHSDLSQGSRSPDGLWHVPTHRVKLPKP